MANGGGISGIFPSRPGGSGFQNIDDQTNRDFIPPNPPGMLAAPGDVVDNNAVTENTGGRDGPDRDNLQRLIRWADPTKTLNIVDEILRSVQDGEGLLGRIGQRVKREFDIDLQSRSDWAARSKEAMRLAKQMAKPKSTPWQNASNIVFPLIATAAIQFNARAFPAIVQGQDVVKGIVVGDDTGVPQAYQGQPLIDQTGQPIWQIQPGAKRNRADRVAEHMSWQFTEEQPEWIEETDRLLFILPIIGCLFRKTFFDTQMGRNSSLIATAEDVVINYRAKSVDTAPRISEVIRLYPYEIIEQTRSGTYREQTYTAEGKLDGDEDTPDEFIEQHRRWDIDGDGYPEPYIVTIEKHTGKVARIIGSFDPEGVHMNASTHEIQRIDKVGYYTKYDFLRNIDGGIYGMGLGQLLEPINEAVNTTLNQMFDAETLRIHGGGFIAKGLGMKSGEIRTKLGEWKIINAVGSVLKDSVVPMIHAGASPVLFQLLGFLVEAAKELASNTEVLSGNQSKANVPASTTLALIEQGLKVFTAVYKRIYLSQQDEFLKAYRLNRLYLNQSTQYRRGDEWKTVTQEDYTYNTGILPIADPSMVSDMQMLARGQLLSEYKDDLLVNGKEIRRRIFTYANIEDVDKLLEAPQQPPDPLKMKALMIQEMGAKADVLVKMSTALLNLANMDKTIAEIGQADARVGMEQDQASLQADQTKAQTRSLDMGSMAQWVNTNLAQLKAQMEMLGAPDDGSTARASQPGSGNAGGGRLLPAPANGGGGDGGGPAAMAAASGQSAGQALPA